jgi:hypothetical protein
MTRWRRACTTSGEYGALIKEPVLHDYFEELRLIRRVMLAKLGAGFGEGAFAVQPAPGWAHGTRQQHLSARLGLEADELKRCICCERAVRFPIEIKCLNGRGQRWHAWSFGSPGLVFLLHFAARRAHARSGPHRLRRGGPWSCKALIHVGIGVAVGLASFRLVLQEHRPAPAVCFPRRLGPGTARSRWRALGVNADSRQGSAIEVDLRKALGNLPRAVSHTLRKTGAALVPILEPEH